MTISDQFLMTGIRTQLTQSSIHKKKFSVLREKPDLKVIVNVRTERSQSWFLGRIVLCHLRTNGGAGDVPTEWKRSKVEVGSSIRSRETSSAKKNTDSKRLTEKQIDNSQR